MLSEIKSEAVPRVSVALATYNGAQFIAEQLASLAAQEVLPCELVVCDDGSGDGTLEIVERFSATAPFPVRVYRNEQNLGFAENFLKAARLCEGEWVAFCDQDDVWLPIKIKRAVEAIERDPGLTLILQNAYICDGDLRHEGRLFPESSPPGIYRAGSRYGFWVWPGFLQTFRSDLFYLASDKPLPAIYRPLYDSLPHDRWTCLLANAWGGFRVLGEPVALYRRHTTTVTGDPITQTTAETVVNALGVGSSQYEYLARIAQETAAYLRDLATLATEDVGTALLRSARSFDTIAAIQSRRAALYSAATLRARLACLAGIAAKGGYIGPGIIALGWKSGAKDTAHAFGLFGLIRRIVG
jgi:glycosyltransferase involved in cell wall biosynthesis